MMRISCFLILQSTTLYKIHEVKRPSNTVDTRKFGVKRTPVHKGWCLDLDLLPRNVCKFLYSDATRFVLTKLGYSNKAR